MTYKSESDRKQARLESQRVANKKYRETHQEYFKLYQRAYRAKKALEEHKAAAAQAELKQKLISFSIAQCVEIHNHLELIIKALLKLV